MEPQTLDYTVKTAQKRQTKWFVQNKKKKRLNAWDFPELS